MSILLRGRDVTAEFQARAEAYNKPPLPNQSHGVSRVVKASCVTHRPLLPIIPTANTLKCPSQ